MAQKWHFWNVAIHAFCQAQIFCCQAPKTILHPWPQEPTEPQQPPWPHDPPDLPGLLDPPDPTWPQAGVQNMCQRVSTADRHFFYFARHFSYVTQNGQKMTQNGQKITQNGPKMTQNSKKWPEITLNGPKWPKMAKNDPKWLKIAQKWHFWNVAIYAFCQAQIFCCQAPKIILHPWIPVSVISMQCNELSSLLTTIAQRGLTNITSHSFALLIKTFNSGWVMEGGRRLCWPWTRMT